MTRSNPLRLTTAALAIAAMSVFAVGCDSGSTDTPNPEPETHGDHGHGHGEHTLGTVEIEGRSVTVNIPGELEAGKSYSHCHLHITGDPVDKMRIWIGDPSGEDVLKGSVTGLGDHPVVDLEAPADLDGAVIGVEIEVDGETFTETAAIEDHHDEHGEGHHDEDDHDHDEHADGDDHDHDGDGHADHE
ncbi:MAG: hypothetical protein AAGA29_08600 [Planctomycetota bacterium]